MGNIWTMAMWTCENKASLIGFTTSTALGFVVGTPPKSVNPDAGKLDANDKANFTTQDSKVYIRFKNPNYYHWSEIECKYYDLGSDIEIKGCFVSFNKDFTFRTHNHSIGFIYKLSKNTKYEFSSFSIEFKFNGNNKKIARFVISYVQIQFENYNRTCSWRGDGNLKEASDSLNNLIYPCESVGPNYTYEVVAPIVKYREFPSHKVHKSSIESTIPYEDRLNSIESSNSHEVRLSSIESSKYSDDVKTIPIDDKWNDYICCAGVCTSIDHSFYDHTSLSETEKLSKCKISAMTLLTK
ncbi:hypothetical protein RF11_12059 [Thelohanellus kitauei]|uniref:Uncharacterized protein n=1 Tax=Thelohanellus kitauei TaxID=669202 RepID=A0A0C2ITM1_THEKT|nr:hypothetical protein RF11_12059 [Thelohanellus kitauei]